MNNRTLWEGYGALRAFGAEKLPGEIAWRVALNINHVRPHFDALEETRVKLAKDRRVSEEFAADQGTTDYNERLRGFVEEWNGVLDQEVTIAVAAPLKAKVLKALPTFNATQIAQLLAIGVITDIDGFVPDEPEANGKS